MTAFLIIVGVCTLAVGAWAVPLLYVNFVQKCPKGDHHEWLVNPLTWRNRCQKCGREL